MAKGTFMYELKLNENDNVPAVIQLPGQMIEFEITEKDLKRMFHLYSMKRMEIKKPFGSYAAHQPNYEGFEQLGKLEDYLFQSLSHLGDATHKLSWGLTVLEHTNVPKELQNEIRKAIQAVNDIKEKLRGHYDVKEEQQ
ncbi:hypothetical protein [Paenibacillus polymyxa]|uniref:hypothetical protein n=1 Tax=Paenibacillus polymyxa TaxID=1406 RepID=UPI0011BF48B3|nr:hypothetical protein [Paenibacillus polymyxa]